MIRVAISGLALGALAACGGTTTPTPDPDPGPDPIEFATFDEGTTIAADLRAANEALGLADPADLPFTGTAGFQGTAEVESTAGLNAIGVMSMTIIFENGLENVTGTAGEFVDENNDPVTGALALTGGDFDRSGAAGANLTATVNGSFNGTQFIVTPGTLSGDLFGEADGAILEGTVNGFVDDAATTYDITIITETTE